MITKISKEDSTTKVIGPSKDATTDVLEARRAARNDYGLASLEDPDPNRSRPRTFQMVSDFNIREVEDLRDRFESQPGSYISDFMVHPDLHQGWYRCSG